MHAKNPWMQLALNEAQQCLQIGIEVPVAALIVLNNQVIAKASNRVIQDTDPTAHAEILVLRRAAHVLNTTYLDNCDLYVTLEPCAMCAGAIAWSRIKRVYFGAYDPKGGAVEHGPRFFDQPTCHHKPETFGGIEEKTAAQILLDFFKSRRQDVVR